MKENKTRPTQSNVAAYINNLEDPVQKADCIVLHEMMRDITGEEPAMWGDSIIGYGKYAYTYASGRSGEWFKTGFSPRKQSITVYLNYGFGDNPILLEKLGKHSTGKACLYIKRLTDVDLTILRKLIEENCEKKYGS